MAASSIYDMPNPFTVDGFISWFTGYVADESGLPQSLIAPRIAALRPQIAPVAQSIIDKDHRKILDAIAEVLRDNGVAAP